MVTVKCSTGYQAPIDVHALYESANFLSLEAKTAADCGVQVILIAVCRDKVGGRILCEDWRAVFTSFSQL